MWNLKMRFIFETVVILSHKNGKGEWCILLDFTPISAKQIVLLWNHDISLTASPICCNGLHFQS